MITGSRSKSRAVHRSVLEQAESFLKDLPKKEKEHLPIVEAINQVAPSVRAALAKGYSYAEVAALLSEQLGVSVSAWSLRRYVPSGKRGKQSDAIEPAPKRPRNKKQEDSAAVYSSVAVIVAPEPSIPALEEPDRTVSGLVAEGAIPSSEVHPVEPVSKRGRRTTATATTTTRGRTARAKTPATRRKTTKGK